MAGSSWIPGTTPLGQATWPSLLVDASARKTMPSCPGASWPLMSGSYLSVEPLPTGVRTMPLILSGVSPKLAAMEIGDDQVLASSAAKHEPLDACSGAGTTL